VRRAWIVCLALGGCSRPPPGAELADAAPSSNVATVESAPSASASAPAASSAPRGVSPPPASSGPLHKKTLEELLSLFSVRTMTEKEIKRRGDPKMFLEKNVGPGTPARMNQGNDELAHHDVSREQCLAGLAGVTIQTPEQLRICGAPNMVPIHHGHPNKAKTCIDVFEFPNQPCELPMVWVAPVQAGALCELQGKRLCAQEEWIGACRSDPEGGKDSVYSYGDELDLTACNTNKQARSYGGVLCEPDSASSAWKTCATNTEPSGSFPRCRSRLGVFDLQGNVAEIMARFDAEEGLVSQLKGSAFFYVDVARKHDERPPKDSKRETYPDHCGHDPRWHVEPMNNAWHVNYHLGFRCCKTVK
jgi:hypothetical protein